MALQDTTGDGRADVNVRFGDSFEGGSSGGTGIALYDGALFAEVDDRIVRYALPAERIVPDGTPEVIVFGLPLTGDHPMHPFAIDAEGGLCVNSGSATNACQVENRSAGSPGHQPCTELEMRAGIWRYTPVQSAPSEPREEGFGRVEPGARGRREVEHEARMATEPAHHLGMLVGGVVVEDDVDQPAGRHRPLERIQETEELLVPMSRIQALDRPQPGLPMKKGE